MTRGPGARQLSLIYLLECEVGVEQKALRYHIEGMPGAYPDSDNYNRKYFDGADCMGSRRFATHLCLLKR